MGYFTLRDKGDGQWVRDDKLLGISRDDSTWPGISCNAEKYNSFKHRGRDCTVSKGIKCIKESLMQPGMNQPGRRNENLYPATASKERGQGAQRKTLPSILMRRSTRRAQGPSIALG